MSEYQHKFTPSQSCESVHQPGAGVESRRIDTTMEPPLQHKKRLGGPVTSLSTDYFGVPSEAPEFTLLGNQEKFATNVKYQPKQSSSEPKIYKNKENFGDASPPSKQLKMQKRIKPLFKERHPPIRAPARQSSNKSEMVTSPPPAPRDVRNSQQLKAELKDKDLKDILGGGGPAVGKSVEEPQQKHGGEAVIDKADRDAPPKSGEADEPRANMNAFVQTNMKKGVADSAPEAPADYALKYKAGITKGRPLWKSSEYQKQFQWKKGAKASPLLAAQEIVYKSNTELGPYKTDGVPRLTEYNRQFLAWKPQPVASDLNLNLNNNNSSKEDDNVPNKAKITRSKSAAPAVRRNEPLVPQEKDTVTQQLQTKLAQTHGKIRRQGTEYRANYKSPTRYSCDGGAWRGASAPQMLPQAGDIDIEGDKNANNNNNNNNASEGDESPPLANWFAEVVELRRRAAEYRKRAQGTHFSREHLLQLMAGKAQCWDTAGSVVGAGGTSDNIRALDLHTRPAAGKPSPIRREEASNGYSHHATEGDSPDMSEVDDQIEDDNEDKEKSKAEKRVQRGRPSKKSEGGKKSKGQAKGSNREARKMAWLEKDKEALAVQARALQQERKRQEAEFHGEVVGADDEEGVEGRLTTPELKKSESPDPVRRHHLDLTTPSVGGAILTCPAPKGTKLIFTSRSGDSYVTASDDFPPPQEPKAYNMDKLLTMPTLGRPSSDTHPLRDEDCESDRPLQTRYVVTPALPSSDEDKENVGVRKPAKRAGKGGRPGQLSAVQEDFSQTWAQPGLDEIRNKRLNQQADDDAVSVSVMSVASSASLASEVLERARKRQQFWDKDSKA